MISPRALKAFLFAFLLVLAGGLSFIGTAVLAIPNVPHGSAEGFLSLIGLALMVLGLIIGFIALTM